MQISRRDMLKTIAFASVGSTALLAQAAQPKIITGIPEFDAVMPNGLRLGSLCYIYGIDLSSYCVANQILRLNKSSKICLINLNDVFKLQMTRKFWELASQLRLQAMQENALYVVTHQYYPNFFIDAYQYTSNKDYKHSAIRRPSDCAISCRMALSQHPKINISLVKNRDGRNHIHTIFKRV